MAKEEEKKWHSYADLSNGIFRKGKWIPVSETIHLIEMNDRMTKFDNSIFKKTVGERKEIRLRKADLGIPFTGFKIYSSEVDGVPLNNQK